MHLNLRRVLTPISTAILVHLSPASADVIDHSAMHVQNLATLQRLLREGKVVSISTDTVVENTQAAKFCSTQARALKDGASEIRAAVPTKVYSGTNARSDLASYDVGERGKPKRLGLVCLKHHRLPKQRYPGHELEYYEVYVSPNSPEKNVIVFRQSKGQYHGHPYQAGWFTYVAATQRCSAPEGYTYPNLSDKDIESQSPVSDPKVPVSDVYAYQNEPVFFGIDYVWKGSDAIPGMYAVHLYLPQRWAGGDPWIADPDVARAHGNPSGMYACRIEVESVK